MRGEEVGSQRDFLLPLIERGTCGGVYRDRGGTPGEGRVGVFVLHKEIAYNGKRKVRSEREI